MPLDFDTLQPHGCFIGSAAVIVLSQHDRARDAALNVMRFFADESCGQCTPCRVGTAKAARLMEAEWDADRSTIWPGDGRRLHLRPGPGGAQPDPLHAASTFAHEVGEAPVARRPAPTRRQGRCHGGRAHRPPGACPMSTPSNDPGIAFELDDELVTAQPGETIWLPRAATAC